MERTLTTPGPPLGPVATAQLARWVVEPFLHADPGRIYNPLTDRALGADGAGYAELQRLLAGDLAPESLPAELRARLAAEGWLVEEADDLATRSYLKYATLEANTSCNQACYFCPVSVSPREDHAMSMDFYEAIVRQLAAHRATLEGVSMIHYNEPTVDKLFVDRIRLLKRYGLPPAVLTNGSGLTPKRVDAILEAGGLRYLSINLSTLDAERYARDRRGNHLKAVLRNLDYLKDRRIAPEMDIAVLGTGDEVHRRDYEAIQERFRGSRFRVLFYEVMDRAGNVAIGIRPTGSARELCGCEQTGSRPLQWLHVTPRGQCVLCCQDYHYQYVVGDLRTQTLDEILAGPEMALLRRWVYGLEEAPADFICRKCVYARTR
jgi:MoaA/NifB/PqqE/SkfB family radical SAM enzyme